MNIFFLDRDPAISAKYHCDKHVVKMILETAQMLCTTQRLFGNISSELYKPTHVNHPMRIWVGESAGNYIWAYNLFLNLLEEYTYRYGKYHASSKLINSLKKIPTGIKWIYNTKAPLCMPDEYKISDDIVESYRNYYKYGKTNLLSYTKREKPYWLEEDTNA